MSNTFYNRREMTAPVYSNRTTLAYLYRLHKSAKLVISSTIDPKKTPTEYNTNKPISSLQGGVGTIYTVIFRPQTSFQTLPPIPCFPKCYDCAFTTAPRGLTTNRTAQTVRQPGSFQAEHSSVTAVNAKEASTQR